MSEITLPRVHELTHDGGYEWVERLIDNFWTAKRFRGETVKISKSDLRKLMEQAYRNGASEQDYSMREAMVAVAKELHKGIRRD
jgi:hypothetical protein